MGLHTSVTQGVLEYFQSFTCCMETLFFVHESEDTEVIVHNLLNAECGQLEPERDSLVFTKIKSSELWNQGVTALGLK